MQTILIILTAAVCLASLAVLVWAGVTRCRHCGSWCDDETDCAERRAERGL